MSDLVRKEEAAGVCSCLHPEECYEEIMGLIPVDAVEVVRCGECEYWKCSPNTKNYGVCRKVSYDDFEVVMDSDDFCSYGVRREDGEEDEDQNK